MLVKHSLRIAAGRDDDSCSQRGIHMIVTEIAAPHIAHRFDSPSAPELCEILCQRHSSGRGQAVHDCTLRWKRRDYGEYVTLLISPIIGAGIQDSVPWNSRHNDLIGEEMLCLSAKAIMRRSPIFLLQK
jgi:hypothetical protein